MTIHAKTAFVFPGVGVKHCGAELPFYERHLELMESYIHRAEAYTSTPFARLLSQGKINDLQDREQQFFTYAYSSAVAEVFRAGGIEPLLVAGYSFGVYGALYASRAIDFETGLKILDSAYEIMSACKGSAPAGMGVVVGLSREDVEGIISSMRTSTLHLVTINSETCQVIAGHKSCIERFIKRAEDLDAFSADLLPVDIPYHHPTLLCDATSRFEKLLQDTPIENPTVPVVSSIDQKIIKDRRALIDFVARNLTTPIDWSKVARALHAQQIFRICECGPGLSLSQNGRFLPFDDAIYVHIKNAKRRLSI